MKWRALLPPLALAALAAAGLWLRSAPPAPPRPTPPPTFGDFSVDTATGPLLLSQLQGRVVLLYFGYTACPDICPTTLQDLAAAVGRLPEERRDEVAILFVSVDPERDDVTRLADYTAWFGPGIVGATAQPDALARIGSDWGVSWRRTELGSSALAYAVDHSTQSFLLGRRGELLEQLPHGVAADELDRALGAALGATAGATTSGDAPTSEPGPAQVP